MSIISKIFGTHSDREIRRVQIIADRVDALEEHDDVQNIYANYELEE